MIVCLYDNCATGCNKVPVEAVVVVTSRYSGFAIVAWNYGNPGGSVGGGARCGTRIHVNIYVHIHVNIVQFMYGTENCHD